MHDQSSCRFCRIANGKAHNGFDQILYEDKNYFAIASLGGFVPGWTLVCSKEHLYNCSECYHDTEFDRFVSGVHERLAYLYGPCVQFEHGARAPASITGCGTDHAHLHLVPLDFSLVHAAKSFQSSLVWTPTQRREVGSVSDGSEYLWMADGLSGSNAMGWLHRLQEPVSQFFRQVISQHLGQPELSDYKQNPLPEAAIATSKAFRGALAMRAAA